METETLFLADATTWTHDQLVQVIREQLANHEYTMADNLRTAVWYCPEKMTSGEFVRAAVDAGVNPGTARNRFHEARAQLVELAQV